MEIKESITQQVEIQHPELAFIDTLHALIVSDKPRNPKANILDIECRGRRMDRSPCGTGTSAKLATLWAKGELKLGETYVTESVIGTLFHAELTKEVKVGNLKAVIPEITGRAFITGIHNFLIDEDDPFKYSFRL